MLNFANIIDTVWCYWNACNAGEYPDTTPSDLVPPRAMGAIYYKEYGGKQRDTVFLDDTTQPLTIMQHELNLQNFLGNRKAEQYRELLDTMRKAHQWISRYGR